MARNQRFHDSGSGSFFGDIAYQRVLGRHRHHFLVMLNEIIDWKRIGEELLPLYKGRGRRGRPPYEPQLLLKMLFLCYLYNVSERSMEEFADTNMLAKWFMGLMIEDPAPDHSTLRVFRRRLEQEQGRNALQGLFDGAILAAQKQELAFGELRVLDSVHTQADVDQASRVRRWCRCLRFLRRHLRLLVYPRFPAAAIEADSQHTRVYFQRRDIRWVTEDIRDCTGDQVRGASTPR